MAAPMALQHGRRLLSLPRTSPGYSSHPSRPAASLLKGRILPYLYNRFYDMEALIGFGTKLTNWNMETKNKFYLQIQEWYRDDMAAAVFTLMLKGGVRFRGQTEWYRERNRSRYRVDLVDYQEVPLEAVDFSGSIINYDGLGSLVDLKALKHLDLSRCPNIDDWSLSRLHVFGETLEELSLAGCPRVTERGLGCLHHLERLRRLDVSDLPSVPSKGLVRILLEEMLPQCEVVGIRYDEELDTRRGQTELPPGAAPVQKTREISA